MQKSTSTAAALLSALAGFLATLPLSAQTTVTFDDGLDYTDVRTTTAADPLTFTTDGAATQSGLIDGDGSLTKTGAGSITLTATNAYSGGTLVNEGILAIDNDGATTFGTLGSGTTTINGDSGGGLAGTLQFLTNSSAGGGAFTVTGGTTNGGTGGVVEFHGTSSAGTGTFTAEGAIASGASGGGVLFFGTSTAGGATLIANDSANGGAGGSIYFVEDSLGGTATVKVYGNGFLDIGFHNAGVTIGSLEGTGQVFLGANNLTIGSNNATTTFAGTVQGSFGSLTKTGTGTLVLSGTNTYTGGTTITAGILQLGDGGTTGSVIGDITNDAALVFNRSDAFTYADIVSGSGSLTQSGTGTLTLSGDNTYTGVTTISDGTLQLGDGGTTGGVIGNIVNNATLVFNRSDAVAYAGVISGSGSLTQSGTGTLTLSGLNTYTGVTRVTAGTLALADDNRLSANTTLYLTGGNLDLGGHAQTFAGLGSASSGLVGNITAGAVTTAGDTYLTSGTYANTWSGTGRLFIGGSSSTVNLNGTNDSVTAGHDQVIIGGSATGAAGLVKLGNANALAAATENVHLWAGVINFNGQANVRANSIVVENGDTSALVNLAAASTASFAGGVTLANGTTQIGGVGNIALSGAVSGAGGFTKTSSGTLTLSGTNTYTGNTSILAGALVFSGTLASGDYHGTIANSGSLTLAAPSADQTLAGVISGTGSLTKTGTGTLTLSAANTYTGATTIGGGLVKFATNANLGTGRITLDGGGLQWAAGNTADISARLNALGTGGGTFDTNSNNVTLTSVLSGTGALTKSGTGTLTLAATNTYTGGTVLNDGTLALQADNALGSGLLTINGGNIRAANAGRTLTNAVTVNGDFTLGRLTNLAGAITLTNDITITSDNPDVSGPTSSTLSGVISGAHSLTFAEGANPIGTIVLSGTNTYTGGTTINGGLIAFSSLANFGTGAITLNGGGLQWEAGNTVDITAASQFNRVLGAAGVTFDIGSNNVTFASALSGSGGLTKAGYGTLTLSGANTYSGGTTINGGTLVLGSSNLLAGTAALTINDGTLALGSFDQTVGAFTLASGSLSGTGTLTASSFAVQSGSITATLAGTGALVKTGDDTLSLSAANTYTGGTTVNGGLVNFASLANFGTGAITVNGGGLQWSSGNTADISARLNALGADGTTFAIGDNNVTFASALAGTGGFTKTGSGTLTLSGANTYSGGTTIKEGLVVFSSLASFGTGAIALNTGSSLQWASGNTADISSRLTLGIDYTTLDTNGNDVTFASSLSGSVIVTNYYGTYTNYSYLIKAGAGSLSLSGATNLQEIDITGGTVVFTAGAYGSDLLIGDQQAGIPLLATPTAAILTGAGATLSSPNNIIVGYANEGTASLAISGGATATTATTYIGYYGTGEASMALSGAGSTLTTGGLYLGSDNQGPSSLTVSGGATATATNTYIGFYGTGEVTLSGAGSKFTNTGNLRLAYQATDHGTLNLGSAAANAATAAGILNVATVTGGLGAATLQFNTTGTALAPTYFTRDGTSTGTGVNTAGGLSLVNTAGTTVLSGTLAHTGATMVNGGSLIVNGSLVSSPVTVVSGATLGGSGTLGGLATFASGARLAPGNSPGTLTFTGGLTLAGGTILDFQLGTTSDLIRVSGGTLTGPSSGTLTVNLSDSGGFTAGTYTLIDATGASLSSIGATSLDLGTTIAGYTYSFTQNGNLFQLIATASAVPEPSTCAALFGAVTLAFVVIRRRSRT